MVIRNPVHMYDYLRSTSGAKDEEVVAAFEAAQVAAKQFLSSFDLRRKPHEFLALLAGSDFTAADELHTPNMVRYAAAKTEEYDEAAAAITAYELAQDYTLGYGRQHGWELSLQDLMQRLAGQNGLSSAEAKQMLLTGHFQATFIAEVLGKVEEAKTYYKSKLIWRLGRLRAGSFLDGILGRKGG